jgi:hypothetical protein
LAAFDDLLEEVTKDMDSAMVAKLAPMTFEEAKQLFDEFDHKYEKSEKEFLNLIVLQAKTNGSEAIFMLKKILFGQPDGVAQWTPHLPLEQEDPVSNPARVGICFLGKHSSVVVYKMTNALFVCLFE